MVIAIIAIIAAALVALFFAKYRLLVLSEKCDYFEESYFELASCNVDLRLQLDDALAMISRQIATNAQAWAENEATKVVH